MSISLQIIDGETGIVLESLGVNGHVHHYSDGDIGLSGLGGLRRFTGQVAERLKSAFKDIPTGHIAIGKIVQTQDTYYVQELDVKPFNSYGAPGFKAPRP